MRVLSSTVKSSVAGAVLGVSGMAWAETADYVFTDGYVYTVEEANPEAEAVAVSGNKIVFVGSATDAEAYKN